MGKCAILPQFCVQYGANKHFEIYLIFYLKIGYRDKELRSDIKDFKKNWSLGKWAFFANV